MEMIKMKGWYGNKQAHSLASKGIRTRLANNPNNTNKESYVEEFEKLYPNHTDQFKYLKAIDEELMLFAHRELWVNPDLTKEELKELLMEKILDDGEAVIDDIVDIEYAIPKIDWKNELLDNYNSGGTLVQVEVRSGRRVWIDLENVNPLDLSPNIEEVRGDKFWGMPNMGSESGWYFDFDEIEEIIERAGEW